MKLFKFGWVMGTGLNFRQLHLYSDLILQFAFCKQFLDTVIKVYKYI